MATYGLRQFDKVQVSNVENTSGSAEAATEIFTGRIDSKPWNYKTKQDHYYSAGALIPRSTVPTVVRYEADFTYENDLDDREICWLMSTTICQPSIATNTWTFEPTWVTTGNDPNATNGIETFTWEMGNNELDGEVEYVFGRRIEISGSNAGELCAVSCDLTGRQFITAGSFTDLSSTGVVAREYFPFELAEIYIDTTWAGLGTNQVYGIEAFSWVFETGFYPHFVSSGQRYFYDVLEDPGIKKATLSLTIPVVSTAPAWDTAELPAALAGTARYIRIKLIGSAGSSSRYVQLDGKYTYTDFPEGDTDSLITFACTLESCGEDVGKATVDHIDVKVNSSVSAAFP